MAEESGTWIRLEQLLRQIDFYFEQSTRRYLLLKGISYPRFILLVEIYFNPGLSLTELYEKLCVTLSTVSTLADQLVINGLLNRERRSDDRRLVELSLTKTGYELLKDIFKYRYTLARNILEKMSTEDTCNLIKIMDEFVCHIHDAGMPKRQNSYEEVVNDGVS